MNKGLAITGGAMILFSIFGFIFAISGFSMHGPDSENILHDTETDGAVFEFDGDTTLLEIYAKGEVDCYGYSVSVTDDFDEEYFYQNCEGGTDVSGYTYLGDLDVVEVGDYAIDAQSDIVIIDADGLFGPIFAMCGGGVCCLVGILLLIIGLATGKKVPQVVVFQQPGGTMAQANLTTVQQYIPPSTPINQVVTATQHPDIADVPEEQSGFEPFSFEHKKKE